MALEEYTTEELVDYMRLMLKFRVSVLLASLVCLIALTTIIITGLTGNGGIGFVYAFILLGIAKYAEIYHGELVSKFNTVNEEVRRRLGTDSD